jgi:hypothetical protein
MNATFNRFFNKKIISFYVFIIFFVYFQLIIRCSIPTDIQGHIELFLAAPHFHVVTPLYSFLVYVLSGLSLKFRALAMVSTILLAACMAAKFYLSQDILDKLDVKSENKRNILAFMCLFLAPIPINSMLYFNTFPITILHNSTSILAMVFVLLIFRETITIFQEPAFLDKKKIFKIIFFAFIMLLAKPSFLFAYIPALPATCLLYKPLNKYFKEALLISSLLFAILLGQVFIFSHQDGGVALDFFFFHKQFSADLSTDIFKYTLSILFPLSVLIVYKKEKFSLSILFLSWVLLLFAIIIGFSIVENNDRKPHGNFLWQIHMCNYLLFLVSTRYLNFNKEHLVKLNHLLPFSIFIFHFLSGINYFSKIITQGSYQ